MEIQLLNLDEVADKVLDFRKPSGSLQFLIGHDLDFFVHSAKFPDVYESALFDFDYRKVIVGRKQGGELLFGIFR